MGLKAGKVFRASTIQPVISVASDWYIDYIKVRYTITVSIQNIILKQKYPFQDLLKYLLNFFALNNYSTCKVYRPIKLYTVVRFLYW